jgi:hypothetical protein
VHGHQSPVQFRFLEQLKQRNVLRVAVLYLVVCWLILEPVHVLFHMLDVPVWANRLVVVLMAVGFPAAVIFAWVYEITPEGLKPTVEVPHGQSIRKLTGRRLDRAIIAVLAVALAYFVIDKFWISKHVAAAQPLLSAAQETAGGAKAAPTTTFTPPPLLAPLQSVIGVVERRLHRRAALREHERRQRAGVFFRRPIGALVPGSPGVRLGSPTPHVPTRRLAIGAATV